MRQVHLLDMQFKGVPLSSLTLTSVSALQTQLYITDLPGG